MTLRGLTVARKQIENHQAAGSQLALLAVGGVDRLFISLTRSRIVVAIEELRISYQGIGSAALRSALEVFEGSGSLALAFQLPSPKAQIVGECAGTYAKSS